MGNRKKDILRKMRIVYMGEGLNTIDDLPKSQAKTLSMESKRQSIEAKRLSLESKRQSIETKRLLRESKERNTLNKSRGKRLTSESSSVASIPSQCSNSVIKKIQSTSKTLKPTKKEKLKKEKPEAKPKFESLLKNLPLTERRLFHARNGVPFKISDDCDELSVDYSSMVAVCTKQLSDFTDVNDGELKIMNMWNMHTTRCNGRGFSHLPKMLESFIKDKGREIVEARLFRNAILMITSFQHNGILDAVDCLKAKSQLQIHVAEHMKDQQPPSPSFNNSLSHGVQTSTFYGSSSMQSTSLQTPSNFRRSLDDHLPCRRNLSPDQASRTLSLDTREIEEDERPRISRKGRSRLNSKGGGGSGGTGGSPGRGSPVRGNTLMCAQSKVQLDTLQSSTCGNTSSTEVESLSWGNYRRSVIVSKRGSAIRKGLWQGDTSERTNITESDSSTCSTVDETKKNRLSQRLQGSSSSQQPLPFNTQAQSDTGMQLCNTKALCANGIQPLSCNNGILAHCAHKNQPNNQEINIYDHSTKRKQDSPTSIENFLEAFDHKIENSSSGLEDIESNLPVFVVVPKSKKRREMAAKECEPSVCSKNPNQKENITQISQEYVSGGDEQRLDGCVEVEPVYSSQRRTSRSKTN